jgi:hypothetical protein
MLADPLKVKIKVAKDLPHGKLTEAGKAAVEIKGTIVKVISGPNKLENIVVKP